MPNPNEERKDEPAESAAIEEIAASDARSRMGELVSRAEFGGERIVITRHGKPVAAIIGAKDLELFERLVKAAA